MIRKSTLILAAVLIGALPIASFAEPGQEEVTAAGPVSGPRAAREQRREDHIEGHIAFLQTELGITAAQQADWNKVADAMRDDVSEYHTLMQKYGDQQSKQPSAVDSLTSRTEFAELRASGERRFVEAFRPLYASFSASQKQSADELFANEEQ